MTFRADPHLASLKQFQRATVDHVAERFYRTKSPVDRFLVADETGLGKSLVARGVIARTIEKLQDDSSVDRIDIVYVCSNTDIANQNLERLDVLDAGTRHRHSTRLTLLARDTGDLNGPAHKEVGKRVNLVSFTPGTSFALGRSTGRKDERALLHVILSRSLKLDDYWKRQAAAVVLQGSAGLKSFQRSIASMEWNVEGEPDPSITRPFLKAITASGVRRRFKREVEALGRRRNVSDDERARYNELVGEMRSGLAAAGVDALEPDLIILDEFQRFRHLLAIDDPHHQEAAELAHALFNYGNAKVLLLSATPYKPFTYAEEASMGDDHEADLRRTLGFLAGDGEAGSVVGGIVDQLAEFRRAAIDGSDTSGLRKSLEDALTELMSRTERPRLGEDGMLLERDSSVTELESTDVRDFAALRKVAAEVGGPIGIDYWKSTPYFINFADGYQLGNKLRQELKSNARRRDLTPALRKTQRIPRDAVDTLAEIDAGNARLRAFMEETVDRGWWKLLWVPPSSPYIPLGGPYAEAGSHGMTKRLIFSSWTATPTAIAALTSHEALRQMAGSGERLDRARPRLRWRMRDKEPASMSTLAVFWPAPALARRGDPTAPSSIAPHSGQTRSEAAFWRAVLSTPGAVPDELDVDSAVQALMGRGDDAESSTESGLLRRHVELACEVHDDKRYPRNPNEAQATVDTIASFAPGNVAFRCLERIVSPTDPVTEYSVWRAAAIIASGVRSLFNRPDVQLLIDQLIPADDSIYWQAVLQYCEWGGLEAVLDEYLHHLSATGVGRTINGDRLIAIATHVHDALTIRPSPYSAFDPLDPDNPISLMSRFALRYGNKRAGSQEGARQPEIRNAFNSPFWPFVLATTSVGQEGIDFHWWCHSAVHWNTPASPVDFEQREGRVHRYGGHAIRRNLAHNHSDEMIQGLRSGRHPWDIAFEAGVRDAPTTFGELAPHWITSGRASVERRTLPYPLSRDHERYQQLKDDLAVYRLTFGQPRQEDLAELLKRRGVHRDPKAMEALKLDLRPRP